MDMEEDVVGSLYDEICTWLFLFGVCWVDEGSYISVRSPDPMDVPSTWVCAGVTFYLAPLLVRHVLDE